MIFQPEFRDNDKIMALANLAVGMCYSGEVLPRGAHPGAALGPPASASDGVVWGGDVRGCQNVRVKFAERVGAVVGHTPEVVLGDGAENLVRVEASQHVEIFTLRPCNGLAVDTPGFHLGLQVPCIAVWCMCMRMNA